MEGAAYVEEVASVEGGHGRGWACGAVIPFWSEATPAASAPRTKGIARGGQSNKIAAEEGQSSKSAFRRAISLARWSERALVDALLFCGRGEEALILWGHADVVSRRGGVVPAFKLGGRTLLRLLKAAGEPRITSASSFLAQRIYERRTEAEGVRHGLLPEILLIKACADSGDLQRALHIFNETLAAKAAAPAVARAVPSELSGLLNAVLAACATCAAPAKALHILLETSSNRASLLDDGSLRQVLLACCSGLELHRGFEVLRSLPRAADGRRRGGIEAVLILMNACELLQDATLALELLRWASREDILGEAATSQQAAAICSFLDVLLPSDGRPPPLQLLELALTEYWRAFNDARLAPFVTFRLGRGLVEGYLRATRPAQALNLLREARVGGGGGAQLLALPPHIERTLMGRFFNGSLPGLTQLDIAAAVTVVDEFNAQRQQAEWPPFQEHRGCFGYWNRMRGRGLHEEWLFRGSCESTLSHRAKNGEEEVAAKRRNVRRSVLFSAAANTLEGASVPLSKTLSAMRARRRWLNVARNGHPWMTAANGASHWQTHRKAIRYGYACDEI